MNGKQYCKGCGAEIIMMNAGRFRNVPLDPVPVRIRQERGGNIYVSKDGQFLYGVPAEARDDATEVAEGYIMHKGHCNIRAPRRKPRTRPSGYR